MMHTLGFFHEMARNDREEDIVIAWPNIEVDRILTINVLLLSHIVPLIYY